MSAELLRPGSMLGDRFRVRSCGMSREFGTTYVAWDTVESRAVHLLVLAAHYGTGQGIQRRLARLQQAVADQKHRSLVPYQLVGADRSQGAKGHLFLVRRLLEGQTLAARMAQDGQLEPADAVGIAAGLCQILAVTHQAGLVHGGLSPSNLLLQDDGDLVVAEAGLWSALHPAHGQSSTPATPSPWRSPEQASGAAAQPSSDVFAIGALLYYMLTGRPPSAQSDVPGEPGVDPPPLQQLAPGVPTWLAQAVHRTLNPERSQRYRHAGQLLHILRSGAQGNRAPPPSSRAIVSSRAPEVRPIQPGPDRASSTSRRPRGSPVAEPSLGAAGAGSPGVWSYAPGSALPALHDQATETRHRRRRRSGADLLLLVLLVAAVLAVLGLIPLWWTVYQRWSAALEPIPYLPY